MSQLTCLRPTERLTTSGMSLWGAYSWLYGRAPYPAPGTVVLCVVAALRHPFFPSYFPVVYRFLSEHEVAATPQQRLSLLSDALGSLLALPVSGFSLIISAYTSLLVCSVARA